MPIDKKRDMWKPGMPWEQAVDDMKYVRGLAAELGEARSVSNVSIAGGRYTIRERIERDG